VACSPVRQVDSLWIANTLSAGNFNKRVLGRAIVAVFGTTTKRHTRRTAPDEGGNSGSKVAANSFLTCAAFASSLGLGKVA